MAASQIQEGTVIRRYVYRQRPRDGLPCSVSPKNASGVTRHVAANHGYWVSPPIMAAGLAGRVIR